MSQNQELSPLEKKLLQLRSEARALATVGKTERMAQYKIELRAKLPVILDSLIKVAGEDGDYWHCSASNYIKLEFHRDSKEADVILGDLLKEEGLSQINTSMSWLSLSLPEPE